MFLKHCILASMCCLSLPSKFLNSSSVKLARLVGGIGAGAMKGIGNGKGGKLKGGAKVGGACVGFAPGRGAPAAAAAGSAARG